MSAVCSSKDPEYNSPLIGNGQIVTVIGPSGFHNGFCPEEERVNRTIFWAGRRLHDARSAKIRIPRVPPEELIGPTIPLIRFGRLDRSLMIDGVQVKDDDWEQTLDTHNGTVISRLRHGSVVEKTSSLVCLNDNMLVFHTRLENRDSELRRVEFSVDYRFGDSDGNIPKGARLNIRRPYPTDLTFGDPAGTRSMETDLNRRPPDLLENVSVQYEIEGHVGEVRIGRYPIGIIRDKAAGGTFIHRFELGEGEATELWFWVTLSDRTAYTHFPEHDEVLRRTEKHRSAWAEFWGVSDVTFADSRLNAARRSCQYALRCNASPWTLPPGYLSTHWEGRAFWDEFFPFMALISGNHTALAHRIPNNRLNTLEHATQRAAGFGASYGWETTELGEESAPFGHWTDEQFRHGTISEQSWRFYLHTADVHALERFYPVIRGCAVWLMHDVLERDEAGRLRTRLIADVAEGITSAHNSCFTASATIRALENAYRSAVLINRDAHERDGWLALANELRASLPVDDAAGVYRYADDADLPASPETLGMVYPFSFDVGGEVSSRTARLAYTAYLENRGDTSAQAVLSYNWLWSLGWLATILFYIGMGDEGLDVLKQAPQMLGPFFAPNEHYRREAGAFLPWLTSSAGAFIYASNAVFVQVVDEQPAVILPTLPEKVGDAKFNGLLTTLGVTVSGEIRGGKVVSLAANSATDVDWAFRIPQSSAAGLSFVTRVKVTRHPDTRGYLLAKIHLRAGSTGLIE